MKRSARQTKPAEKRLATERQRAVYDERIQQWKLDAAERLGHAKILLVKLHGIGSEIGRHLVYAGIRSITLLDSSQMAERLRSTINRINSKVEVLIDTGNFGDKSDDFFRQFAAVFATNCTADELCKLNHMCRNNNVHFFCADTWGMYAYSFADLGTYTYLRNCAMNYDQN